MMVCAYDISFGEQEAERSGIQVYNELNASLGCTSSCLEKARTTTTKPKEKQVTSFKPGWHRCLLLPLQQLGQALLINPSSSLALLRRLPATRAHHQAVQGSFSGEKNVLPQCKNKNKNKTTNKTCHQGCGILAKNLEITGNIKKRASYKRWGPHRRSVYATSMSCVSYRFIC